MKFCVVICKNAIEYTKFPFDTKSPRIIIIPNHMITYVHYYFFSSNTEELLAHMLELLRIKATTHILNWVPKNKNQNEAFYGHQVNDNLEGLTTAFLKSACETVRRRSTETAVTFLYLPAPPSGNEEYYVKYLDALTSLTDNWPPTLMVRGVSPVTSTTL